MKLLTLTLVAAAAFVGSASAQQPYSDGQLLLKRRPFGPGPNHFAPPPPVIDAPPVIARGPIYSPYSMIRYEWLPATRPVETLPVPIPVKPGAPTPAKPEPAKPPVKPISSPIELRPNYLPEAPAVSSYSPSR